MIYSLVMGVNSIKFITMFIAVYTLVSLLVEPTTLETVLMLATTFMAAFVSN